MERKERRGCRMGTKRRKRRKRRRASTRANIGQRERLFGLGSNHLFSLGGNRR